MKLCLAFKLHFILTSANTLFSLNSHVHVSFSSLACTGICTGFSVLARTFAHPCVQGRAGEGHHTNASPSAPLFHQSTRYCYGLLLYINTFYLVPVHLTKHIRVAPGRGSGFQNVFEHSVQVWYLWCPCSMALSKALKKYLNPLLGIMASHMTHPIANGKPFTVW